MNHLKKNLKTESFYILKLFLWKVKEFSTNKVASGDIIVKWLQESEFIFPY